MWKEPKFVPIGFRGAVQVVLAAVFAAKFAVLWQLADHPLLQPGGGLDSDYYYRLAQRVASGDLLLGPGLYFVSPLYIYFLGTLLAAGCSLFAVKVVQIALGTVACALVGLAAREWFGGRAGALALALAALTGVFTFYEVLILQAALDPFLMALVLWLLTRAIRNPGTRFPVLAGVCLAVQALNRPNMLLVAAGVVLALLVSRGAGRQKAVALGLGLAVGFAPVSLRNYAAAGTWTPVPSHGGLNLYIGNNENADGTYRSVEGITPNIAGQAEDARRVAEATEGRDLTDAEVSQHFTRRALTWMREHPGDAGRLFVRKVAYVLNRTFLTLNYSYPFYRDESSALRLLFVGPAVLIPLGLVGLFAFSIRGEPRPPGFPAFAAVVPLLILSIAIFFVASRYRVPLLVALCITSGALLDIFGSAFSERRNPRAAVAAVCVLIAGAFTLRDLNLNDLRAEEEAQMALAMIDRQRWTDADRYIARAAAGHHDPGRLHLRVADAYVAAKRPQEVILHLEKAHQRGARTDLSSYQLAAAYLQQGRTLEAANALASIDGGRLDNAATASAVAELNNAVGLKLAGEGRLAPAVAAFERAVRLAPSSATGHLNLAVAYAEAGRLRDAREEARRALALNPSYQRAKDFLAALSTR